MYVLCSFLRIFVLICIQGCMESLVYYKQLILRSHRTSLEAEEKDILIADCAKLLEQLQAIDPERRQRYVELGLCFATVNNTLTHR